MEDYILRLTKVWLNHPELRLGQLIENVYGGDTYFYTNEEFISRIENFYEDLEKDLKEREPMATTKKPTTDQQEEWCTVKLEYSLGIIKYICSKLYPKQKITDEQIAEVLSQMVVDALDKASKKTVKELEEIWEIE
jgi:hypothetical protein